MSSIGRHEWTYLCCHDTLSFSDQCAFSTNTILPVAVTLVTFQRRDDTVVSASGAFRRPLVAFRRSQKQSMRQIAREGWRGCRRWRRRWWLLVFVVWTGIWRFAHFLRMITRRWTCTHSKSMCRRARYVVCLYQWSKLWLIYHCRHNRSTKKRERESERERRRKRGERGDWRMKMQLSNNRTDRWLVPDGRFYSSSSSSPLFLYSLARYLHYLSIKKTQWRSPQQLRVYITTTILPEKDRLRTDWWNTINEVTKK